MSQGLQNGVFIVSLSILSIFFWKLWITGVYFYMIASWISQLCDFTAPYVRVHLPLKYFNPLHSVCAMCTKCTETSLTNLAHVITSKARWVRSLGQGSSPTGVIQEILLQYTVTIFQHNELSTQRTFYKPNTENHYKGWMTSTGHHYYKVKGQDCHIAVLCCSCWGPQSWPHISSSVCYVD